MRLEPDALSTSRATRWGIDPAYHAPLPRMFAALALLACVQWFAWLIPTPQDYTGIPYYLLLHSTMEIFSIVISMMVFIVGWNSQTHKTPDSLTLLSSIFFVVGLLDFSHTFSYVGMPDYLSPNDQEKHLSFWLSARLIASVGLLVVCIRSWDRLVVNLTKHFVFGALVALGIGINVVVVYHQELLPQWFVPGVGLTPFKKNLEYLCITLNLITAAVLLYKMRRPQTFDAVLMFGAVGTLAMSELFFTMYTTMTGLYNVLGHIYKVIAYYLIYRAVVVETIDRPYREIADIQKNLEMAVSASNTGLWDWSLRTEDSYYSPVWKSQLGYTDSELPNRRDVWETLLHPDDREGATQRLHAFLNDASAGRYENEFRLRHKDGSYHWVMSRGQKQCDAQGRAVRISGSHTDITESKRNADRFRRAVEASPTAMVMVDEKSCIVLANSKTDKIFGYSPGSLIGTPLNHLIPQAAREQHAHHHQQYLDNPSERLMGEGRILFAQHRDGHHFRVEIGLTPIAGQDGRYVLASVVDITERIESQQHIEKLINYDALTGLPNRRLLKDRVDHAIQIAQRARARLAVLFLDLDRFKYVNDTLGPQMGDALLVEIANRLAGAVRSSDTLARVGGDEFVIVLSDADEDAIARVASNILHLVSKSYTAQQHELVVTPSIGIAMYPNDGEDFETLLQHADTAMSKVKEDSRNDFRFFAKEMQQRTARVLQLDVAMHQALERKQFHLVYQPQLSVDGRKVVGVEALLRWNHPELGMVSPAEFIPLAEGNGHIVAIGTWVLRTAVQQLKDWLDSGLPPMVMAVNLSAVQFRHTHLPDLVSSILSELELPPEYLELELTESVTMDNPVNAIAVMDKLHSRGIRMSIDDFGTGYSSLNYLKKFSVYKLKIDQSFVRDIATDADDRALVTAIIQMARSLGFITIAEGVETQAQCEFLQSQGCDEVQGYLFSKPLQPDFIPAFVSSIY